MLRNSTFARTGIRVLGVTAVVAIVSCSHQSRPTPIQTAVISPSAQETWEFLQSDKFAELDQRFAAIQLAYTNRTLTDEDLRAAFRVFYKTDPTLASKYDVWVSTFPKSYTARLARGIYYAYLGNALRGKQSRDETPSERLDAASIAYGKAKADLDASFAMDSKPLLSFVHAMTITGDRGDLDGSRRLLDRAISIDQNNYIARAKYMTVIETRWGGSQEMMKGFLEECRQAKLSEIQMHQLESVIAEDQGWVHQFVDRNYAAAESDYRK